MRSTVTIEVEVEGEVEFEGEGGGGEWLQFDSLHKAHGLRSGVSDLWFCG